MGSTLNDFFDDLYPPTKKGRKGRYLVSGRPDQRWELEKRITEPRPDWKTAGKKRYRGLTCEWTDEDLYNLWMRSDSPLNRSKSSYRGVYYDPLSETDDDLLPWVVKLVIQRQTVWVGRYESEHEGARAYDLYLINNRISGRKLNFNRDDYD